MECIVAYHQTSEHQCTGQKLKNNAYSGYEQINIFICYANMRESTQSCDGWMQKPSCF